MIENILQDLMEQQGVNATLLFDGSGQLFAHRGHAIYDQELLQSVSSLVAKAIDSIELLHEDWDSMQAKFGDGALMLRNLGNAPSHEGRLVLAVVADTTLNHSFATVAMRVVVQKLRQALARPPPAAAPPPLPPRPQESTSREPTKLRSTEGSRSASPQPSLQPSSGLDSGFREVNMASGLSWSGASNNQSSAVWVADEPAHALLDRITRVLAHYVGPMAKIFVKEAVREICQGTPFGDGQCGEVRDWVARRVENPRDRDDFLQKLHDLSGGER